MNRQDFIFTLFDNGNGLTLDEIQHVEEYLPDLFPDGIISDLINNNGMSDEDAAEAALYDAREVFLDDIGSARDMLELRDIFIEQYKLKLTDKQVVSLWYVFKED